MITVLFVMMAAAVAPAQVITEQIPSSRTGAGVRAGLHPGFSLRHFIAEKIAVTGLLQADYKYNGRIFTLLYEWHAPLANRQNLKWIGGGGFHTGLYRTGILKDTYGYIHEINVSTLGFDGILGLEYYMKHIPFTIGADVKPYFNIVHTGYGYIDGALNIRYTF
jgi:hypothetical protein